MRGMAALKYNWRFVYENGRMDTDEAVRRLAEVFGGSIWRSPLSGLTAPGSGDIASTSKGFLLICRANKSWNGF